MKYEVRVLVGKGGWWLLREHVEELRCRVESPIPLRNMWWYWVSFEILAHEIKQDPFQSI